jgi:hypothetical protein
MFIEMAFKTLEPWVPLSSTPLARCRIKRRDTVGQLPRTEIGVPNLPSWKAKKLSQLPQEKVLLELCRRLANSIPPFFETPLCVIAVCK